MINLITKDEIKDMFPTAVYRRGNNYYKEGRVRDLCFDAAREAWVAKVRGSQTYKVTIQEDDTGISTGCNCPAFDQYWNPCKHVAAVMLKIYETESRSTLGSSPPKISRQQLLEEKMAQEKEAERQREKRQRLQHEQQVKRLTNQFIRALAETVETEDRTKQRNPLLVEWIVKIHKPYYSAHHFLTLEMKVGPKRTYVLRKIKDFLKAVDNEEQYPFTKSFTYDPLEHEFAIEDQEIIDLLQTVLKYEEVYQQFQYRSSGSSEERAISIPPMLADELLVKLGKTTCQFENGNETVNQIQIETNELPFSMELGKGKSDQFQLDLSSFTTAHFLDFYGYLIQGGTFYKLSSSQVTLFQELKKVLDQTNSAILPIESDQMEPFLSHAVPALDRVGNLKIADKVSSQIAKFPLQAKAFVDRSDDLLHVSLEYHYGEHKLDPFQQVNLGASGPILMRDAPKEQRIMDVIESAPLKFNGHLLYLEGEAEIYDFLYRALPKLEGMAEIYLTNAVKSWMLPEHSAPVAKIEVDSTGNLLEVNFSMDGIEQKEILNILRTAVEKKRYYRLPSGAFVSLESEEFQTVQNIVQEFHIHPSQLQEEKIQLPLYRGLQLDEMTENGNKAKYGKQFRRLLSRLKNPEELEFEVPETLQADLRDYQQNGFQWLKMLSCYRFGGILADDMGLGKTLQSIAFILSETSENKAHKPALIVAPASLVYNWQNECRKFAPSLKVEVLIGSPQERLDLLKSAAETDVWITSYPTLRQDIDTYKQLEFSTFILDEAQAIKNYATKTAKAVRDIHARTRFALSGTPIENSVDELWSIFQAIMPGFFPSQKDFRQLPPEKVAKMIKPFLLRRVKKDVLKELPDKIETVNYSELNKQQKELYLGYLEKIKAETIDSLEGEGFQKSRMKILAGLTRLRQLCCHPSLFLENYQGDSGKLDQLMEIVKNALANGKRPLIFSQFTSMLAIIREQFTKAGVHYFYLDGQTPPRDRVKMVDQFNEGEGDIFLISLKAGNTGLNLTGADTVILYDLWWNPAVEEQAAGRAHRIGQKNVVQVIRLITQGTIEEKIYELQQNKKELIETVIQPGEQGVTTITEQEIREILNI